MKARESKAAKDFFRNETKGRAILNEIHKASTSENPHVATFVKIGDRNVKVKEL